MMESKGNEVNRPLDQEILTLDQAAKVTGGVQVNTANFNTTMINTAMINTANFNTANINTANYNIANINFS